MRNISCLLAAALLAVNCPANDAAVPEWENLAVNSINRLPARTYSMPLADERAALTDALEPETPYKKSLNGVWKISWAGNPELRVRDFWRTDFDDSDWFTIDVPSCVELRGFGSPGYTNVNYPHAKKWPKILDRGTEKPDYNPVSSYRTTFTVPADWKGRDVILRFDGVYSAYYVWVNGQKVGYAEDSKLPSEFDVTAFLRDGENLLAVEVYRWCDGSYLEDQDMFRYSGIFRDVTLWARPKDGIWDFTVKTFADGRISVDCPGASWKLYDADFKEVASPVMDVRLWSAEKPYLYTLVLKKGADIRMKRVGFKEQRIEGHTFLVNGKPVKFKGVNRHETNPENGRAITLDDMLADIRLMKKYNINTVRTSHYPNHHLWYDLCDRYGLYIVAEANVEGHEPGYGKEGLGLFPEWDHSIVERNARHATFYRNNACVTMWSLGNETGHGDCFRHAIAAVKKIDPSRPVHWERGNIDADVDSRMYPTVEWLEKRGEIGDGPAGGEKMSDKYGSEFSEQSSGKCFFLCEYAHAMGNAIGNFQEYWDAFYRHDSLSGGCIWDWVDQAVWKETGRIDPKTGKAERFFAYGGDFDETPNDGPFCNNGVVGPLREVTAKLIEVGHVHRNLVVTRSADAGDNGFATVFELWNRFVFTSADEFVGVWKLRENGTVTKSGGFAPPALAPLARCRFTVPGLAEALAASAPGAELFVDFEFRTKEDALWAEKGWVVARDQVALGNRSNVRMFDCSIVKDASAKIEQNEKTVTVTAGSTKAVFCRKSGTLCELVMNERTVLKDAAPGLVAGPRLTCMRALTDNDVWMRRGNAWSEDQKRGSVYSRGLTQLRYHARPLVVKDGTVRSVVEVTGSKSAGFTHESVWSFAADGSVSVENTVTPHGTMPPALPRLGLSLRLDPALEAFEYYGRGPRENYVDRLTGSFLGRWTSTVADQFENYVRPQDNGFKSDVRWVQLTAKDGKGVRFAASEPMFVQ
ncbi:MAG: DUF4981 domain-containing protein, partial [Kiritimatiellae bacterium]|nr:DUF4981 domain-containing protein [Kiritimatiellia bacterium]